ncbi:MAG: hypothetical protein ABIZ49_01395, partial [Opitutaceae bacterium]
FASVLFAASLCAADMRYTRAEGLAQLQNSYKGSEVVFLAKLETRKGKRVLVCQEVIKSSKGLPAVGEAIVVDAPVRGVDGREGIVFMQAYPVPSFSGVVRWLRDGVLNEVRELTLADIKSALGKDPVATPPVAGTKP